MTRVLIIEDEIKIAQVLKAYCEREQFTVSLLESGATAVEVITRDAPDFIILDVMLPGKDGLTICREVRQFSTVPIIMLTARVDEIDRLLGLELGADDYVCKPFSPREVIARMRTILRRVTSTPSEQSGSLLCYGAVTVDPERHRCEVDGKRVELTPVELRILTLLLTRPGRVYPRDTIIHSAYDDHRVVSDRTIDSHIKNLRRKLEDNGADPEIIRSIYGVGYKLE